MAAYTTPVVEGAARTLGSPTNNTADDTVSYTTSERRDTPSMDYSYMGS
jgi:hypothetical protein